MPDFMDDCQVSICALGPIIFAHHRGPSIGWEADKIVSFTVARDGEELELSGKVGTPTATAKGLLEDPAAAESTVELRKAWLYN